MLYTIIAITGLLLGLYNAKSINSFFTFIFIIAVGYLYMPIISPIESGWNFLGIITLVASLNILVSAWVKHPIVRTLIGFASLGLLPLLGESELMFNAYSLDFHSGKMLVLPFVGFGIGGLLTAKKWGVSKWFSDLDLNELRSVIFLLGIGIGAIAAMFAASWVGFLFIALGLFVYQVHQSDKSLFAVWAILSLAVLGYFVTTHQVEGLDFTIGKLMAGLFFGAFLVLMAKISYSSSNRIVQIGLSLVSFVVVIALLKLDMVYSSFGGYTAFLTSFIGVAISAVLIRSTRAVSVVLPILLVVALQLSPEVESEAMATGDAAVETVVENEFSEMEALAAHSGQDMKELKGTYSIDAESALIEFKLGPKGGITKGAIKNFTGTFDFSEEDISTTQLDIVLPTKNVTTFNKYRDESIMEASYLNVKAFPNMTYVTNNLESEKDGYWITGMFELLGVKKEKKVFVKYLGNRDGMPYLVGAGTVDRTDFGMPPSPQEGDIVTFTFEILLTK